MLIDGFTVIAQIINFLLLVWLLWRFLYKPILATMDERQQRLQARWQEADTQRQAAEQAEADYRQKQHELEQARDEILAEAKQAADAEQHQWLQQARAEVEAQQAQWQEALEQEQAAFLRELQQQVSQQVYAIAGKVLQQMANADLETEAVNTFLQQVQQLPADQRQALTEAAQTDNQPAQVRSAFALSESLQQHIQHTLQQANLLNGQAPQFTTDAQLICGVELRLGGQSVAWTVADSLHTLEEQTRAVLQQQVPPSEQPEASP